MEGLRCATLGLFVITLLLQGLFIVPVHCKNATVASLNSTNSSSSSSSSDTEPVVLHGKTNSSSTSESEPSKQETLNPLIETILLNSTDDDSNNNNDTEPVNISGNSAEVEKAPLEKASLEKAENATTASDESSSSDDLENLSSGLNSTSEASKKDKRQAQRGYTDIPLDEGPFQDLANSSPSSSLANFESDLPPLAESLNNDLPSTYPAALNINRDPDSSFFARRVGLPDPIIPPQDYAKRVGLLPHHHHQDNIAAAAVPLQERVDADDNNCGDACDGKPIPGEAGTDYPVLAKIPKTSFSCKSQQWPGYYADTEARCQVFWICQKHRMDAFLCPNGTLFNQQVFVCDWWFNVDCNASPEFYSRNQYLYAGPGIGIDGKPTRFRGGSSPAATLPSSSNTVLSIPRPSGVNSNAFVNQVQSSNQIARVATVSSSSVPLASTQQQQPLRNTNAYYESSSSNNQQQKYSSNSNNNNQQQQKYQSVQNMLSSRMQKNNQGNNPTGKPLQASSSNQVVGGYQTNHLSLNSQSELDRRSFSSQPLAQQQHHQQQQPQQQPPSSFPSGGGGRGASYEGNHNQNFQNRVPSSTTGRPESYNSPSPSSPRPSPSPSSPTPRIIVNIDTSKSQKQTLSSFSSNNINNINSNNGGRSISSTGRPFIQVNSEVPLFAPGSSSTQRPVVSVSSTRNPLHNFASSSVNLIGSSQNINNSSIVRQAVVSTTFRPPGPSSTGAPPSRDYIPNLAPPPKPTSPSPAIVHTGSTGRPESLSSYVPPLSNHNSNNQNNHKHNSSPPSPLNHNYIPETTTPLSTNYGAPGHTPGTPQSSASSSVKPYQQGFHTFGSREFVGFHGQRSNQFSNTNVNGQREIMYSPSASNIYAEFPYSPSQQKNKQRLLELQNSKGISSSNKDIFSYPHFHGQRSNAFSDGDSVSYIQNNNKKVNINHGGYSQRTNPFTSHLQPSNPNSVHGAPNNKPPQPSSPSPAPINHNNIPTQQFPSHQNQPIHHQQPIIQQVGPSSTTPHPHNPQLGQHQQQQSQQQQNVQQYHVQVQPTPPASPKSFQSNPQQQQFHHQNPHPQQHFTQNQPQPQPSIQHYSQQQPNHLNQHLNQQAHLPYATPSPTPPFHQRIATMPAQHLELPSLAHGPLQIGNLQQQHHHQQQQPAFNSPDGYTSLQSGSYISIATSPSPFSKQILKHSVFQGEPQKPSKNYKNNGPAFVTTSLPIVSNHNDFNTGFISSTGQPYLNNNNNHHHSVSLSTTLRPPSIHSSAAPFTNHHAGPIHHQQPTAYPSQNNYIAAPTQSPVQTTSPGHRQNPYLPHNHGKNKSGKNGNSGNQPQYPNSVISTTINYPEGTGSLKVLQGSQGTSGRRNLVDFSYKANPTSSPTPYPSSTTRFPSGKERFNGVVGSTTGRPYVNSSPSPQSYKEQGIRKGSRLAGAVINKSTSSSSAIYVDNADTAESVSTPVSVSPSASPAVATANYGLRISSTAKKRMAGAWQNYFSGNEKEQGGSNSTVVADSSNEDA